MVSLTRETAPGRTSSSSAPTIRGRRVRQPTSTRPSRGRPCVPRSRSSGSSGARPATSSHCARLWRPRAPSTTSRLSRPPLNRPLRRRAQAAERRHFRARLLHALLHPPRIPKESAAMRGGGAGSRNLRGRNQKTRRDATLAGKSATVAGNVRDDWSRVRTGRSGSRSIVTARLRRGVGRTTHLEESFLPRGRRSVVQIRHRAMSHRAAPSFSASGGRNSWWRHRHRSAAR
jgi:hypothetical protein